VCGTSLSEAELEGLAEAGERAGVRILQMEAILRPVQVGRPEGAGELRVVG
jgi:hypothetical protein